HYLTPADRGALDDRSKTVVLVDDELTTGKTARNTIRMLNTLTPRSRYVIATLADLRDARSRTELAHFADELGIDLSVVSLFSGELTIPLDAVAEAQQVIAEIEADLAAPAAQRITPASVVVRGHRNSTAHPRDGVADLRVLDNAASEIASLIAPVLTGSTLVLGIEEDMYVPLRTAVHLEQAHRGLVHFGATTRSPALAYDHPDYGIRDVISYQVPQADGDTSARFLYNVGVQYDAVVIITGGPAATDSLTATANSLLSQLSMRTDRIHIIEAQTMPAASEPLRGPEFGSYPTEDVTWLLKDLSDVALEVSAEDREEAVQNGGMHYAEALPIEYQPTPAYQDLFRHSLTEHRRQVALHVATAAERIWTA
ncbi:phosphoribosyltransferase domain-containing protein, partial [Agromyces humi]|uniref:phosphoribosyltransferase domain-containing protein n=1 Tax=Agromyces humi TaxID=1766800 RepID=UPI0019395311